MRNLSGIGLVVVMGVISLLALLSVFTVEEDEQALVLQFGEPVRTENAYGIEDDAGLKYKIPLVQTVRLYDRRNLELDLSEQEILASDQERLTVDAFVRYRITDLQTFYERFNTRGAAEAQMRGVLDSLLRDSLASVESQDIIAGKRAELMTQILNRANIRAEAENYGVTFVDVRIKRADLPKTVADQVFQRMNADRGEDSARNRGEGERESKNIRAEAAKQVEITLAEAQKQAEIIRGEGDNTAIRIYAEAYNQDPEFYAFYRSMEAYRNGLGEGTTYVLSPDSDFLSYLDNQRGGQRRR